MQRLNGQIGRKLNALVIAVLVLAVAMMAWRLFLPHPAPVPSPARPAASGADATTTGSAAAAPPVPTSVTAAPSAFDPPADSLVVLPFANLGGDAKQQYFSDGITEELTNALGQNTAMRVIAWGTASKFRDTGQTASEVGRVLNVANLLHGSIHREGDQVRVTAELVNTITGYQVWSQHYDDMLNNIFAVQDKISAAIASALQVKFAGVKSARTANPQAHDLVLKGLALMNKRSYEEATQAFEQAIALDPTYAAAHAALARTWLDLTQNSTVSLQEALPKARAAAREALALDPDNVGALIGLALADAIENRNAEARAGFERALAIDPSNATAQLDYALVLPPRESQVHTLEAVRLDPQNTTAQSNLATGYLDLGQYPQALTPLLALLELDPHNIDTEFNLALTYFLLQRNQDAAAAFDRVQPTTALARQLVSVGRQTYQSLLDPRLRAQALAALDALRQQADLDPFSLADLLQLYMALGEHETVLQSLPGYCAKTPVACTDLSVLPTWLPLHDEPRFQALVGKYDVAAQG